MNITISMDYLAPSTIATIIADLLSYPNENAAIVKKMVEGLETIVGDEASIDYLLDAGIIPSDNEAGYEVES